MVEFERAELVRPAPQVVESVLDFAFQPIFASVAPLIATQADAYLKIEGLNPGGSIKLKPALALVRALEREGALRPGSRLIETTSGNMGVALSLVACARGYSFTCVSDEKITAHNRALVRAYGADVVILPRSTLADRYRYIEDVARRDATAVWPRQFTNAVNPAAHESTTAAEILAAFPKVDWAFIGVGTGGTIAGCAAAFARRSPSTRIIAVDAAGSRHFRDAQPGPARTIPGIGATERSPFLDGIAIDDVVIVEERDAVRACRQLVSRTGWLLGGSSGSVLFAMQTMSGSFAEGDVVIGVAADMGERYLDTVHRTEE